MVEEDDLVPLSALQHYLFCDRQAALIHMDRVWVDNALTVEGSHLHESVDSMEPELRGGILIRRSVAIQSSRLGVTGRADVIELHPAKEPTAGAAVPGLAGRWRVVPIEYKRGRPKSHRADEIQLCAQAICLEEEFGIGITQGYLFYGRTRRRTRIEFDGDLRALTEATAQSVHEMLRSGSIPIRHRQTKCRSCSLIEICLPPGRRTLSSARSYLDVTLGRSTRDGNGA
jgi:CRISPR-associated exonuclease Cas4